MVWGFFGVALRLPVTSDSAVSPRSLAAAATSRLGATRAELGAAPERAAAGLALGACRLGTGAAAASCAGGGEPVKVCGKDLFLEKVRTNAFPQRKHWCHHLTHGM